MPIAILVHLPIAELCLSQFLYTFPLQSYAYRNSCTPSHGNSGTKQLCKLLTKL